MKFSLPQIQGRFIERENRFVATVRVDSEIYKVHVPNTGRCKELLIPDAEVILEKRPNPDRKYPYELIMVKKNGNWVSIDSQLPNKIAAEGIRSGKVDFIDAPYQLKMEQKMGNSRFDIALIREGAFPFFIEVKGVTLEFDGVAMFPDAPTERGRKHLDELIRIRREGYPCGVLFVIQMEQIHRFRPYYENDAEFGKKLEEARKEGVMIKVVRCRVSPEEIEILDEVHWDFMSGSN